MPHSDIVTLCSGSIQTNLQMPSKSRILKKTPDFAASQEASQDCGARITESLRKPVDLPALSECVVALGPVSFLQLGLPKMQSISTSDWSMMLISGVFNSIGFFAITHAYRVLTISRANVINASQNAICAIGAVLFFAEPLSGLAAAGIGLTILGLIILDRK